MKRGKSREGAFSFVGDNIVGAVVTSQRKVHQRRAAESPRDLGFVLVRGGCASFNQDDLHTYTSGPPLSAWPSPVKIFSCFASASSGIRSGAQNRLATFWYPVVILISGVVDRSELVYHSSGLDQTYLHTTQPTSMQGENPS